MVLKNSNGPFTTVGHTGDGFHLKLSNKQDKL